MLKIDHTALIQCRLGLIDAQKFRTSPAEYIVMMSILLRGTFAKVRGYFNEVKWFH